MFVPEIATPAKIARIGRMAPRPWSAAAPMPRRRSFATPMSPKAARCQSTPMTRSRRSPGPARSRSNGRRISRRLALPALDTVLIAVGGGGLISGVAAWFAGRVKVVGVEPEGSRALHAALEAGRPVDVPVQSIAADSLGAKRVGELNFAIARQHVAEVVLVPDAAIVEAQRRLWRRHLDRRRTGRRGGLRRAISGAYRQERANASAFSSAARTPIWRRSRCES